MRSRCLARVFAHRNVGPVSILGVAALLFGGVFVATLEAQALSSPRSNKVLDSAILENLTWRGIGPAVPSGRVNDFAVVESNTHIIYAATATGGAWKTTNNGTTWEAVFDRERTSALGAIAVAPSNPNVVWVGTGESWGARLSAYGDGVYRSEDGGKTWQHMGLEQTRYIGRILIHPEDAETVYVAALGSLWGPNDRRGLFKTADGGKSWTQVLSISKHTGVVDVAMDPENPDLLYAAAYQRERRAWNFVGGGEESGIFKTSDGGESWQERTAGLPQGDIGRIALSICRSKPNVIYAAVEAVGAESGVYRSSDYGASWELRTNDVSTRSDFGQIRCDPNNPERIYLLHVRLFLSEDGGKSFRRDVFGPGAHGDWRGFWIDPGNSNHLIVGNDGGVYFSYDRGRTWDFQSNIPVSQFYAVSVDFEEPFYNIYGGLQDNGTFGGPSGTRHVAGITNADWSRTAGGDGFYTQVDPTDPTVVYCESQYGVLYRFDTRTGERRSIQPRPPDGEAYRWNWSSPLRISRYDSNTLYFAANVVFRSRDRGDSWEVISPDLTLRLDPYELPIMGKVWPSNSVAYHQGTADLGNVASLSESPLERGLLAVGTDDGLVHVTRDDGRTWEKFDRFPGVPEQTWVTRVLLSAHDEETIYATFAGHRDNDFRPHVLKSTDLGKNWEPITGDLPDLGTLRVILEHPSNPNLLFVGTELGVFVSISGGGHWVPLRNNLPTVLVHDLLVHPRKNDLVVATYGRGLWILDDLAILEEMTPEVLGGSSHLARIRPATELHRYDRHWGSEGHRLFAAPNPPDGAIITYYINPDVMSSEEAPRVQLDILNATKDRVVRKLLPLQGEKGAGIQRLVWDLRHPLPFDTSEDEPSFSRGRPRGPFVLPGNYQARLSVGEATHVQSVKVMGDPLIDISLEDRRRWHDTLLTLTQMEATVRAVVSTAGEVKDRLTDVQDSLERHPDVPESLRYTARTLLAEADEILGQMSGGETRGGAEQRRQMPIASQVTRLYSSVEAATAVPTADQRRLILESREKLNEQVAKLNRLVSEALPALNDQLTQHGVSWTPGRPIGLPPSAR